jgi:phosphoribosylaminoimidazolecarboxamide formyltransferase/IMP cyclohydrolase
VRQNLRLITTGTLGDIPGYDMRVLKSGVLLQDRDKPVRLHLEALKKNLKVVTRQKLSPAEIEDLLFAWKCVKVVKSNAIVITQGRQTVGIGAGQMSRVDSVEIACSKAGYRTDGGFLASDAFFPMPDSIEMASEYKIRAIIQPGGSVRDADVIAACDRFGIAMVFTGERHFRH